MNIAKADLQKEVIYRASRSGGKGGQNVNKVSTKVELLFDAQRSALFTQEDKQLIAYKLQNRLNRDGLVQVISEEERSQLLNKERAMDKLYELLIRSLEQAKPRKTIKIGKAAKAKRLDQKRMQSVKKQLRKGASLHD